MVYPAIAAKIGATLAGLVLGATVATAAAFAGMLPSSTQNIAHSMIGAPAADPLDTGGPAPKGSHQPKPAATATPQPAETTAPEPAESTTSEPAESERSDNAESEKTHEEQASGTSESSLVGPDAAGPATHGLCTAWTHHQANGAGPHDSAAFTNLEKAAAVVGSVEAYCSALTDPPAAVDQPAAKGKPVTMGKPGTTGKPMSLHKLATKDERATKASHSVHAGTATTGSRYRTKSL